MNRARNIIGVLGWGLFIGIWTVTVAQTITPPYLEMFNAPAFPTGWTQTISGQLNSNRWSLEYTDIAGGTPYEAMATWAGWLESQGTSRLISPPVNTTGISELTVAFKHHWDDYSIGIFASVQYSHDLIYWQETDFLIMGGLGSVSGEESITISFLEADVTYIAWSLEGNHYNFNGWYVDDVGFDAEVLPAGPSIRIDGNGTLSWLEVPDALAYDIYSADTPNGIFNYRDSVINLNWSDPLFPQNRQFYRVRAVFIDP